MLFSGAFYHWCSVQWPQCQQRSRKAYLRPRRSFDTGPRCHQVEYCISNRQCYLRQSDQAVYPAVCPANFEQQKNGASDLLRHVLHVRSQHSNSFLPCLAVQAARKTLEPYHIGRLLLRRRAVTIWLWARSRKRPHRLLLYHYSCLHPLEREDQKAPEICNLWLDEHWICGNSVSDRASCCFEQPECRRLYMSDPAYPRLLFTVANSQNTDQITTIVISAILDQNLGIIAACIPTFQPLFRLLAQMLKSICSKSASKKSVSPINSHYQNLDKTTGGNASVEAGYGEQGWFYGEQQSQITWAARNSRESGYPLHSLTTVAPSHY